MTNKRTNTASWQESRKRWRISVQKNGIRKEFFSSTPGRTGQREANTKADAWLEGERKYESLTVQQAFDRYVSDKKEYAPKCNWRMEQSHYDNWIKPLAKKRIEDLVPYDFQKIINAGYKKGLSRKTLSNIRGTCTQFLKFCRLNNWTALTITDIVIPADARKKEKHILQPQHLQILFASSETFLNGKACFDDYIYAYRFQVLTGLRPGELIGLKWSDIDDFVVHVKRAINRDGEITKGKNENALRDFYLNDMTRGILKDQKNLGKKGPYVFAINSSITLLKRFSKYCAHNGIPHTTPYELRHTFVSMAKNLSEGQLKQIVGHSKSMDTYGIYSHNVDGDLENAAKQLEQIFNSYLTGSEN